MKLSSIEWWCMRTEILKATRHSLCIQQHRSCCPSVILRVAGVFGGVQRLSIVASRRVDGTIPPRFFSPTRRGRAVNIFGIAWAQIGLYLDTNPIAASGPTPGLPDRHRGTPGAEVARTARLKRMVKKACYPFLTTIDNVLECSNGVADLQNHPTELNLIQRGPSPGNGRPIYLP